MAAVARRSEAVRPPVVAHLALHFAANRHTLDTFLRYHHEQGLSPRRLKPEELFAPESLESSLI